MDEEETPKQKLAALLKWLAELAATKLKRDEEVPGWYDRYDESMFYDRHDEEYRSNVFDNGHTVGRVELARSVLDSLRDIGFTIPE